MTCSSCADRGVFRVGYHDGEPSDFALCLCKAGEQMRCATNNGRPVTPQWQVWAFRQGIPIEHVLPMEDLLDAEEMAARGFHELPAATAIDAIAAAARARKGKGAR